MVSLLFSCFLTSWTSAPIFIISFVLLYLGLYWSLSLVSLRWKLRLLIFCLSSFITFTFNAINLPLSTVFAASHKLYKLYFH